MVDNNTPKLNLVTTCNAIIDNLPGELGKGTVTANGQTYTVAELLAPLKAYVPLPPATAAAKTAYSKAVDAEAAAKEAAVTMVDDVIKPLLQQRLGKGSTELETYGLEPAKTPQKSAAVKAAAAEKGQATRKALGTKGPAQKKAAKKALEEQAATPPAPSTPATAPKS